MENADIKLRVLMFTETKYEDMNFVQWNLIIKQKALKMIKQIMDNLEKWEKEDKKRERGTAEVKI